MDFFDLVEKRRSIRKFSNKRVPEEVIIKALKAGLLRPIHLISNLGNFIG